MASSLSLSTSSTSLDLEEASPTSPSSSHPLLPAPSPTSPSSPCSIITNTIPNSLTSRLYTSHFLSTFNARAFEFAAVLFLAAIFPATLLPLSVYALARAGAAIVFAEALGRWIDRGNRLVVVRASILWQRGAVVGSCVVFWALLAGVGGGSGAGWSAAQGGLFVAAVGMGCVERLAAVINLVAVERDWVVVITEDEEESRRVINARMRRIDLFCKLVGPLAVSSVTISSMLVATCVILGMNLVSVGIEYICIAQVYKMIPGLQRDPVTSDHEEETTVQSSAAAQGSSQPPRSMGALSWIASMGYRLLPLRSLPFYIHHPAFRPSFSLALLYLTVLSFSGQMITYLISVGYTPLYVGLARTISTAFELSATWIAPQLMRRFGVVRGGIWSLSWQMVWLTAGVSWFFFRFGDTIGATEDSPMIAATGLAVGVTLSRIGLWSADLCIQNIVQDEVEFDHRGAFSTVEAAFQNLFEMLSYAVTIVFSRPDQFQWPVVISVLAVYMAGGLYTSFVRKRRGHLFHAPPCTCLKVEAE